VFAFKLMRLEVALLATTVRVACGDDDDVDPVELETIAAAAAAPSP